MHQGHILRTPLRQHQGSLHTTLLQHQAQLLQLQPPIGSMFQVRVGVALPATTTLCTHHCMHICQENIALSACAVSNTKDNPPWNTLFVGNLGDTVSEAELRQLFGTLAGFRQLKLIRGARSVTCFVEFNDLPSAMACHQNQQVKFLPACYTSKLVAQCLLFDCFGLHVVTVAGDCQGAVLNSSDRGGIRIQYSRNPFGKKRDYDGSFINTPTAATYTAPSYEGQAVAAPAYASTVAAPAAYGSGDYAAPAAAPGVEPQQTNGQPASYEAAAQPGNVWSACLFSSFAHPLLLTV